MNLNHKDEWSMISFNTRIAKSCLSCRYGVTEPYEDYGTCSHPDILGHEPNSISYMGVTVCNEHIER